MQALPPPLRLLHDGLLASAARLPDKVAVVVEGKPYTYAQLLDGAARMANAMQARGVQRGDRVAIFMENSWSCIVSIYAALMAGSVFFVINPQTKSDKLQYILDDSGAKLLLADGQLAPAFMPALAKLPSMVNVICTGEVPIGCHIDSFNTLLESASPAVTRRVGISLDLAALIYTSGSTGNPKGVMQTHQSMLFAAGSLIECLRLDENQRIFCVLPLAFNYGLYQLLMAVQLGATLVLERSFAYPAQIFARMHEYRVTVFPGVPTIFALLLSAHARSPLCFPSITRVTNTAAALPDNFVPRLREIFPNALLFKMYGLTECKRVSYLEPELVDAKPGSVGKAIPGTEVFLLSPDGQDVPPGEIGILHVRGAHVMLGYWKRPDLSADMLKPGKLPGERVLCTQDFFRMDTDGFLYFVGRSDDIIKTRGEKVSPVEVENVLHGIAGIQEAAVVGVPDEMLGQAIRAYVVVAPGFDLSHKQIRAACQMRLESFMVPREVITLSALPKTSTGKASKKMLLEQHT